MVYVIYALTLKAPITTAADDKFCDIFLNFQKNKVYFRNKETQQQHFEQYDESFSANGIHSWKQYVGVKLLLVSRVVNLGTTTKLC